MGAPHRRERAGMRDTMRRGVGARRATLVTGKGGVREGRAAHRRRRRRGRGRGRAAAISRDAVATHVVRVVGLRAARRRPPAGRIAAFLGHD